MSTQTSSVKRLLIAGGFAVAVAAAPAVAVFTGPGAVSGTPLAVCPAGEVEDVYTYACVPELVPNQITAVGAPSEQELTQCSGLQRSNCLEAQLYPPAPVG